MVPNDGDSSQGWPTQLTLAGVSTYLDGELAVPECAAIEASDAEAPNNPAHEHEQATTSPP